MKHPATKLLAGAAALGLFVAAPAVADGDGDHDPREAKDQKTEETVYCEEQDLTVTVDGDDVMWPPNHKYQTVTLTAVDDGGDEVMLDSSAYHDEYLEDFMPQPGDDSAEEPEEENGAGNTSNDADPFLDSDMGSGEAQTAHDLRSERSGRGDGRTYTVEFDAMTMDEECSGEYIVEVPHDMGNGAENKRDHTEG